MSQAFGERGRVGALRHQRSSASARDHPYARASENGSGGFFGSLKSFVSRLIGNDDNNHNNRDDGQQAMAEEQDVAPVNAFASPNTFANVADNTKNEYIPVLADEYRDLLAFRKSYMDSAPVFPQNTWAPPTPSSSVIVPASHKKLVPILTKTPQSINVPLGRVVPVMDKTSPARRQNAVPTWSSYRYSDWSSQPVPAMQPHAMPPPSTGRHYRPKTHAEMQNTPYVATTFTQKKRRYEPNYPQEDDMDQGEDDSQPRPSKRMRTDVLLTPFSRVRARDDVAMSVTASHVMSSFKTSRPAKYHFPPSTATPSTSRSAQGKRKRSATPPRSSRRPKDDEYEVQSDEESEIRGDKDYADEDGSESESSSDVKQPISKKLRKDSPAHETQPPAKAEPAKKPLPVAAGQPKMTVPEQKAQPKPAVSAKSAPTDTANLINNFERKNTPFAFSLNADKDNVQKPKVVPIALEKEKEAEKVEDKKPVKPAPAPVSKPTQTSAPKVAIPLQSVPKSNAIDLLSEESEVHSNSGDGDSGNEESGSDMSGEEESSTSEKPNVVSAATSAGFDPTSIGNFDKSLLAGLKEGDTSDFLKLAPALTTPVNLNGLSEMKFTTSPTFGDPNVAPLKIEPQPVAKDESSDINSSDLDESSSEERRKDAEMEAVKKAAKEKAEKDAKAGIKPVIDPEEDSPPPTFPYFTKKDDTPTPVVSFKFAQQPKADEKPKAEEKSKAEEKPKTEVKEKPLVFNPPDFMTKPTVNALTSLTGASSAATSTTFAFDSKPATTLGFNFPMGTSTDSLFNTPTSSPAVTAPKPAAPVAPTPAPAPAPTPAPASAPAAPAPFSFTLSSPSSATSADVFVFGSNSKKAEAPAPVTSALSFQIGASSQSAVAALASFDFSSHAGKSVAIQSKESLFSSDMETSSTGTSAAEAPFSFNANAQSNSAPSFMTSSFNFSAPAAASTPGLGFGTGFGASSTPAQSFTSFGSQSTTGGFGNSGQSSAPSTFTGGFGSSLNNNAPSASSYGGFGVGVSSSSGFSSHNNNNNNSASSSSGNVGFGGGFGGFGNASSSSSNAPANLGAFNASSFGSGGGGFPSGGNMGGGGGGGGGSSFNPNLGGGGGDDAFGDFGMSQESSSSRGGRRIVKGRRTLGS